MATIRNLGGVMNNPKIYWIKKGEYAGEAYLEDPFYSSVLDKNEMKELQEDFPFTCLSLTEFIEKQAYDELKAQLEIAKEALEFECGNRCAIGLNPCNARLALEKLGQ